MGDRIKKGAARVGVLLCAAAFFGYRGLVVLVALRGKISIDGQTESICFATFHGSVYGLGRFGITSGGRSWAALDAGLESPLRRPPPRRAADKQPAAHHLFRELVTVACHDAALQFQPNEARAPYFDFLILNALRTHLCRAGYKSLSRRARLPT